MGYYTDYKLIAEKDVELTEEILEEMSGYDWEMTSSNQWRPTDSCKWYSSDEDMKKFSEKYPGKLFILEGEGEESGDIWKEYFKDGKYIHYQADYTFPEFNEKDLK
jgi:hypothetical protein